MSRSEHEANQALFETCEHRYDTTNPNAAYRTPCAVCTRLTATPAQWPGVALAITLGVALAYLALKWATG